MTPTHIGMNNEPKYASGLLSYEQYYYSSGVNQSQFPDKTYNTTHKNRTFLEGECDHLLPPMRYLDRSLHKFHKMCRTLDQFEEWIYSYLTPSLIISARKPKRIICIPDKIKTVMVTLKIESIYNVL